MSKDDFKRVTGLGGFFFKSENPNEIKDWYKNHLAFQRTSTAGRFGGKTKTGMIVQRSGRLLRPRLTISIPAKNHS